MNWKKLLFGTWSWKRPFYSIGFIYITLGVIALFFSNHIIFLPPTPYAHTLPDLVYTENTDKQKVAAIYIPPQEGQKVLLWSHGNAHDISALNSFGHSIAEYGLGFYSYDYPGYGLSEGSPSEASCNLNAIAAWNHLTKKLGIEAKNIILVGQSIGTGPAVWLSTQVNESGLILISPFTSIYRVAVKYPIYPKDQFPNIDRITNTGSDLLVIHGTKDKVIPYQHSQQLVKKHPGPKTLVTLEGCGHNDMFIRENELILKSILDFTKKQ